MFEDQQKKQFFYPAGQSLLVRAPKAFVIKTNPYQAFPLNTDGVRVMSAVAEGGSIEEISRKLEIRTEKEQQGLQSFLESTLKAGLLTMDPQKRGSMRIKSPAVTPPLERVFMEITTRCNLKCRHCYMSASNEPIEERTLTGDEIREVIRRADELGVYRFDFTGGEPFVREDFNQLLEEAQKRLMIVNIFTNGTMLTEDRCNYLASLGNIRTVFISLDDIKEDVHDGFRERKGAFRKTIEGIKRLQHHNIRVVVNITLWKQNAGRATEIIDYCRDELGVECRIAPIVYVGRGKCFEEADVPQEDVLKCMKKVINDRQFLTSGYCGESDYEERNIPGCGVGHKMIYIRANGEICLCPTLSSRESPQFELGWVGRDDLGTVWEHAEKLKHFRTTQCRHQDCPHLNFCRGGCRSRAFLQNGDLFDEDRLTCAYFGVDMKK